MGLKQSDFHWILFNISLISFDKTKCISDNFFLRGFSIELTFLNSKNVLCTVIILFTKSMFKCSETKYMYPMRMHMHVMYVMYS